MSSLIQQRMAIDRIRTSGVLWTVFGGFEALIAIGLMLGARTDDVRPIVFIVIAGGFIIVGLVNVKRYQRAITAFTAANGANGANAGKR